MELKLDEIKKLSKLCKIELSDEEASNLLKDLERVVEYVELLKEVDTTGVDPCYQVISFDHNVWEEDEVNDVLDTNKYLKNSPSRVGTLIKTPPVIKF